MYVSIFFIFFKVTNNVEEESAKLLTANTLEDEEESECMLGVMLLCAARGSRASVSTYYIGSDMGVSVFFFHHR